MTNRVQTIIGIPGRWADRKALVQDIAGASGGYLFAGNLLMNTETKHACELDLNEHDPNLVRAFSIAGSGSITNEDIEAISAHTLTVYLVGVGGSEESARAMMDAACGILRAGGIAVKIESTGTAHSSRDWFAFAADKSPLALYHAFVTLVGHEGGGHSCGMHNLGLPDATITAEIPQQAAADLLNSFLYFTLNERPTIASGHTFSVSAEAQRYRIDHQDCDLYDTEDPFYNPWGMWRLSQM